VLSHCLAAGTRKTILPLPVAVPVLLDLCQQSIDMPKTDALCQATQYPNLRFIFVKLQNKYGQNRLKRDILVPNIVNIFQVAVLKRLCLGVKIPQTSLAFP